MSNPSTSLSLRESKYVEVQDGNLILVRLPNNDVRSVKIEKDTLAVVGKFGSFYANELINQPYGLTYEISNKKLKVIPPRSLEEVEDTDATNELINDGEFVQPLTLEEIQALKQAGVHASDIIKKQIEQHANYSLKTEYSKEKYKKRKEAKYSKFFTTIEPTLFNVCEYWFSKDQVRIRDVRIDTLSQMLNLANIQPGGRYIAVDDASGLIVAGILERMGGMGKLIAICDTDSPPAFPVVTHMNFRPEATRVLFSLNWATAEEQHTPLIPPSDLPTEEVRSERQKSRLNKRKTATGILNNTREELFSGEFDSLLIASEYDPFSILERLVPYLAGSAAIVIHSPYIQILSDLQGKLRNYPQYLSPTVTEAWTRRYQVLPGRTHPMMATSGTGGFILHTYKVHDNPTASHITSHRQPRAQKLKSNTTSSSSPVTPNPKGLDADEYITT